jgi:hypothetical protein
MPGVSTTWSERFLPIILHELCLRTQSPRRLILSSTQQSLPILDNFPHHLIYKFEVRTFRKTLWMRSILLACTQLRKGHIDRRYNMADLAVYGRLIFKWTVNLVWRRGMDCIVYGLSLGAGRYEGGNDILSSIKITKFWPAARLSGTPEQPS